VGYFNYNIIEVFILNRIKELRLEKNISQIDLAKLLNTSQQSVSFYEMGKRDPDTKTLGILSDFFNVSIDYLLCKSDVKKPEKLLDDYNMLSEDSKQQLEKYIELLKIKDSQDKNKDEMSFTSELGS